jgi:hypothetical protein
MSRDEQRLDFCSMTQNHKVVATLNDVVDLLERDWEKRVSVSVDLDHVVMNCGTLPGGCVQTGPADEIGIGHAEHRKCHASMAAEDKRWKRHSLHEPPGHDAAELTYFAKERHKVQGIGARGHQRQFGDEHMCCDLARNHATQRNPDEAVPWLDAIVSNQLKRIF